MVQITGGFDQPLHFFDAENTWQWPLPLWHGEMFMHVPPLQRFHVQETKRCDLLLNGARGQVKIAKQMDLILTNLIRTELLRRSSEVGRESLYRFDVGSNRILGVITTLELIQHQLA
jgi:hypothetical protein